ncbi:MAG: histidinol dehydrogenase [Acidimicrobiales bacterium mtb01]|nr:histidinol dehydrogenase [Actinomycetota bacterium]TEX45505.1 MAG: histidinol dehydrogenase [Acidimicrobiales bacterium mtb01]
MAGAKSADVLRVMTWSSLDHASRRSLVDRDINKSIPPELREQIAGLVADVRERGDAAVCDALARFDEVDIDPDGLRVSDDERERARGQVDADVRTAIRDMVDHIRRFNEEVLARHGDWQFESDPGLVVGERVSPIASAGLFCPSGKASYPSVLAQLGGPATVAGVPLLQVVVPPKPGAKGAVDPVVLAVADELGIRDVFRVNGPAGIAALAFGTESIERVVKVMGPGSLPVTVAQLEIQRWGTATQMALGPTESLVIADETADSRRLAADLMIEAEHGTDSCTLFVTTSEALVGAVQSQLVEQIAVLPAERATAVRASLGVNGGCVIVNDLSEAARVANEFAPEHLQLVVAPARENEVLDLIAHAGEILIGQDTPFSAANFLIGCPASLPTNGFARVTSGVTVEAFLKRTAVARADERALRRLAPSIVTLADVEGFPAHANALRLRFPDLA